MLDDVGALRAEIEQQKDQLKEVFQHIESWIGPHPVSANDAARILAQHHEEVEKLKKEIKYRDDVIGLSPDGDRHAHLVSEIESLRREKKAREYYQEIVYHICQVLDRIDGKEPGHGVVCGTLETPSTEVQERMDKLVEDFKRLKYNKTTAFAVERDAYEKEAEKWKKAYLDALEEQKDPSAPVTRREFQETLLITFKAERTTKRILWERRIFYTVILVLYIIQWIVWLLG